MPTGETFLTGCPGDGDLPALHDAADRASLRAQRRYLFLTRLNLAALLGGSLAGLVPPSAAIVGRVVAGISLVTLLVALVGALVIRNTEDQRTWYGGRAIAESVKTLAWRYMTRAEPFGGADAAADELFLTRLRQILESGANLNVQLSAPGGDQITARMRDVRGRPVEQRRLYYDTCRIEDQRRWYSRKSQASEKAEKEFFALMWTSNFLAVSFAILAVITPGLAFNPTSLFATAAAAVLAWMNVKRHQEIAQSYAIAAQELGIIHERVRHVTSDSEFAAFVADAENAISREHTLWVARRDAMVRVAGV